MLVASEWARAQAALSAASMVVGMHPDQVTLSCAYELLVRYGRSCTHSCTHSLLAHSFVRSVFSC